MIVSPLSIEVLLLVFVVPANGGNASVMVYHGTKAREGEFASVGYVYLRDYAGKVNFCGATLIADEWALSAAHCFCDKNTGVPKNFIYANVIFGDIDYTKQSKWHQESSFDYVVHEEYNATTIENDIALLHLRQKVKTTSNVKPEALSTSLVGGDAFCQVAGWGRKDKAEMTKELLYANLSITNNSFCEQCLHRSLKPTMLCAYNRTAGAYKGDSGGPLYCTKEPNRREVVGIVSWGASVCKDSTPGVYTKVSAYQEWIEKNRGSKERNLLPLWIILGSLPGILALVMVIGVMVCSRRDRNGGEESLMPHLGRGKQTPDILKKK